MIYRRLEMLNRQKETALSGIGSDVHVSAVRIAKLGIGSDALIGSVVSGEKVIYRWLEVPYRWLEVPHRWLEVLFRRLGVLLGD